MLHNPNKNLIYTARLALKAERYEDMAIYMRSVIQNGFNLSSEERNLLSIAYKNLI